MVTHLEPPRRREPHPSGRIPAEAQPAHAPGAITTLALSREEGPEVTPACLSSERTPHSQLTAMSQG